MSMLLPIAILGVGAFAVNMLLNSLGKSDAQGVARVWGVDVRPLLATAAIVGGLVFGGGIPAMILAAAGLGAAAPLVIQGIRTKVAAISAKKAAGAV